MGQLDERTTLLSPAIDVSVSPLSDEEALGLDDLPIVTRNNTFPLTSPSYAGSLDVIRPHYDDDLEKRPARTPREEQEFEPDPVPMEEFRKSLTLIYPVVITYTLEYLPGLVCVMLVGHIDSPNTKEYVAAATLSTMFTNVTGLSIGFGLSSALDTLCAQAYGAKRFHNIGIYLQSAVIVVGSCLLPIFLLNWNCGHILSLLGQDPEVARFAGEFSRITIFGVPFLFVYEMCRKVLQAQNIVRPMLAFAIVGDCVNIFGGYYLTYHTSLGFHGAALSRTLGYMVLPLCAIPYLLLSGNYLQWWGGWDLKRAYERVPLFLRLGLPALAMMTMEWWAYEVLAVMAGNLPEGVLAVSSHAVLMNVASTVYTVYTGISVSGNIRVGNCLGANHPKKARLIAKMTLSMTFSLSFVFSALILAFRHQIPKVVINDPAAIEYAAYTLLVMGPYQIIDALNCTMQGIYRGAGWQNRAAKINIWAFYAWALPLATLLAFYFHVGVMGLWIGFGCGHLLSFIICGSRLYFSSWEEMALEAQARVAH